MKQLITCTTAAFVAAMTVMAPAGAGAETAGRQNPLLLENYGTPFNIPPFDQIEVTDYLPAVEKGIEIHNREIEAIANNPEEPTFENTILALEQSGRLLNRVVTLFSTLDEVLSSPEMSAVSEKLYPMSSAHSDAISMNSRLFGRIKNLYDRRDQLSLTTPQKRAVEEHYRNFCRGGALLDENGKKELSAINSEMTDLYLRFNKNLLDATNAFQYVVDDPSRLKGLPESNIAVAADEADARGLKGKWVFTLHAPSRLPLLQFAEDRDLRKAVYEGYTSLASSGEFDNRPVINRILKARTAKARLLGYPDFASYMTENVMAKNVKNAEDLLMKIWRPAVKKEAEEVAEMQAIVDSEGGGFKIAPWDYYFYAEKVRKKKYDLNEDEVRAYFAVDSVRKGIFTMAEKLYGVTFAELPDAPKYHPEVKVYEVRDKQGEHVAVFMTDYFPRASKRQGAWMGELQSAFSDPDGSSQRPIVYNVGNFSKPTGDTPSLLTLDELETMFHEFGHGLHGMLTRAELRSQAGTNVDRDFVELPSQIHEHWALEPELLRDYARHYQTGEVIPDELIAKLEAASTHNQGFTTTELAGAALLDLKWGQLNVDSDIDVSGFESSVARDLGLPAEVQFRYRSPYFRHIFGSDGYASGYYTYLWAEVLDTDGFELFKEKGIFDPETARAFRENVLEKGGSEDPMELYIKFRGHEPNVDALLRNRGLAPETPQPSTNFENPTGK
ncbi:MAG: M3 family metallopeptidase [Clostridium sp.]|nr:M3 family metallopeptidase [Clostridium sp.]